MKKSEVQTHLEALYIDYYDGLYTDQQLKQMLTKLYKSVDLTSQEWSEMILDAQWKYASDRDYELKRLQLFRNNQDTPTN
ncbi:hypothetical protein M0651_07485 [Paenibacillus sp. MBLB2552]|uniref:Uncharacterized protein n=1 Tax=Paenibacillus mellifer TaxID=2937794 RepID=A0A9X2BPL3_9BACL|nr:hypothetical protein [Paenibacillus mellifer]MCK8487007.1 hypothetical protein [Paenibacillus mellifer]